MTENTRQVLEMLAEGKITTEEADRLISALREQPSGPGPAPAKKPGYLRVIVDAEDSSQGPGNFNIRVPATPLPAGLRLALPLPPTPRARGHPALREPRG